MTDCYVVGAPPIHESGVEVFQSVVSEMETFLNQLLDAPAAPAADHPAIPNEAGVYLFSADNEALYVGQTRNLRTRLRNHTNALARENQASFAFLVAKTEAEKAGIDLARTRKILEADDEFAEHFRQAKLTVAAMDVRFIKLEDAIKRTLFEVYAALAVDTLLFNSFETH